MEAMAKAAGRRDGKLKVTCVPLIRSDRERRPQRVGEGSPFIGAVYDVGHRGRCQRAERRRSLHATLRWGWDRRVPSFTAPIGHVSVAWMSEDLRRVYS